MKYQFAGSRPFTEAACKESSTDHRHGKLTECDPLNRIASFAAGCVGQDVAHVATIIPMIQSEIEAMKVAAHAGHLILEDLLDHFPELDAHDNASIVDR